MAYGFVEATFKTAVLERIGKELQVIPDTLIREAIRKVMIGLVEEIADELELIDGEI